MLHIKFQGNRSIDFGEEDFIPGRVGHLGHETQTIYIFFLFSCCCKLHMEFDSNDPTETRFILKFM